MFGCFFSADAMSCIIDHIPLVAWLILGGAILIPLLIYFGPILLPIWRMIPLPIRLFLMAVGGAILAYLGGRYKGRANAEQAERDREANAFKTRAKVDHEVDNLSESEVQKRLRDRWSRDKS